MWDLKSHALAALTVVVYKNGVQLYPTVGLAMCVSALLSYYDKTSVSLFLASFIIFGASEIFKN